MIEYIRIFSDAEGCSHFEIKKIELTSNNYAPPALPLYTSSPESTNSLVFLELPKDWFGEWHPTPVRQWLILMTGEVEIETGNGNKFISRAGDVVLLDDTTGKGHQSRALGNEPVRIAALHFS
ncbi:MAG: cupin domain-containing protein [Desulfofustis sp.]|nr:cupin domain-containing protein [Desulfofustis sp.]NNK56427.1 cupin domain-containing protein [Desulfofustis sp.]